MRVIFVGHAPLLITDYNRKRYVFPRGKEVEITQEVYDYLKQSNHVSIDELRVIDTARIEPQTETVSKQKPVTISEPKIIAPQKKALPKKKKHEKRK